MGKSMNTGSESICCLPLKKQLHFPQKCNDDKDVVLGDHILRVDRGAQISEITSCKSISNESQLNKYIKVTGNMGIQ